MFVSYTSVLFALSRGGRCAGDVLNIKSEAKSQEGVIWEPTDYQTLEAFPANNQAGLKFMLGVGRNPTYQLINCQDERSH